MTAGAGLLTEERTGLISLLLHDEALFSPEGWEELRRGAGNGFVPCYKIRENGLLKLYYDIEPYTPLYEALPRLTPSGFRAVFVGMIDVLRTVCDDKDLSVELLELSFEKIFVDVPTSRVYFIYRPLRAQDSPGVHAVFERILREKLAAALFHHPNLDDAVTKAMRSDLASGQVPLFIMREKLKAAMDMGEKPAFAAVPPVAAAPVAPVAREPAPVPPVMRAPAPGVGFAPYLALESADAPETLTLIIDRPEYFLGKSTNAAHGVIPSSPFISKRHCVLRWEEGQTYVTDLNSLNGTRLNGALLGYDERRPVRAGDYLRLADRDFVLRAIRPGE